MKLFVSKSPTDLLVVDYHQYLTEVAGLRPSTCQKGTFYVRLFLRAQFGPQSSSQPLRRLEPAALPDFALKQGRHYRPGQLQSLASALRLFCRFLCVTGRHPRDLSAATQAVSGHHREDLPRHLSPGHLQQWLAVFDRRTLLGQRDFAMVLCLARLGLRAGEVACLTLDDLWHRGQIRLAAPKGRRECCWPLPEEVAGHVSAFLRNAPLTGPDRQMFRTRRGDRPMRCDWLFRRIGAAVARAGGDVRTRGASVAPDLCHEFGPAGRQSQSCGRLIGPRQPEHDAGLCQGQPSDAAECVATLARGGAAVKTRSLKAAVAFYPRSRRRLGLALKSEGAFLENFLQHAQALGHRGPLTGQVALDWAQEPPPSRLRRCALSCVTTRTAG